MTTIPDDIMKAAREADANGRLLRSVMKDKDAGVQAIALALMAERGRAGNEAFEKAAKVIEGATTAVNSKSMFGLSDVAVLVGARDFAIAATIRAMAERA
jgi:hypothetical protein